MALEETFVAEINSAVEEATVESAPEENNENANQQVVEGEAKVHDGSGNAEDDLPAGSDGGDVSNSDGSGTHADGSEANKGEAGKETPVTPPAISDAALTSAVQAGFSLEQARQFGNEALLKSVVYRVLEASKKNLPPVEPEPEADLFADLPSFEDTEEVEWQPEVKAAFGKFKEIIEQQNKAIKSLQEYSQSTVQLQQDAAKHEVESWFDKQTAALGADFEDALGKGPRSALDPASSQYQKREAIANQAAVLLAGYKAAGQQAPPRDQVFDTAAKLVLMDEYQKIELKKISGDLAKRSQRHIQRAGGGKQTNNNNPLDETAALLDAKYFAR